MALLHIEVRGLRNLTSIDLSPSPAINIIVGANGSGKTSLLEAIHLVGMARSFRTQQAKQLIQAGQTAATIYARVESGTGEYRVGIMKQLDGTTLIRVNSERQSSSAILAELLPLQVLTPESHSLLQGEPKERRAFLDWGLFHVEQRFHEHWKRYRRYLEQRNAALRGRTTANELQQWEVGLAEHGEAIARMREVYVTDIYPYFCAIYRSLVGDNDVPSFSFRQGWPRDQSLADALNRNRSSEQKVGYTMAGPHRSDLKLMNSNDTDVVTIFSRGQQKLAVCALRLAQMQHLRETKGKRCTLLLDDLPAELDVERRRLLMRAVVDSQAQCFVTATDRMLIDLPMPDAAVFHVEHGVVAEVL